MPSPAHTYSKSAIDSGAVILDILPDDLLVSFVLFNNRLVHVKSTGKLSLEI